MLLWQSILAILRSVMCHLFLFPSNAMGTSIPVRQVRQVMLVDLFLRREPGPNNVLRFLTPLIPDASRLLFSTGLTPLRVDGLASKEFLLIELALEKAGLLQRSSPSCRHHSRGGWDLHACLLVLDVALGLFIVQDNSISFRCNPRRCCNMLIHPNRRLEGHGSLHSIRSDLRTLSPAFTNL